jgi:hypothetical protein
LSFPAQATAPKASAIFVYTFHLCIHHPLTLEKFMPLCRQLQFCARAQCYGMLVKQKDGTWMEDRPIVVNPSHCESWDPDPEWVRRNEWEKEQQKERARKQAEAEQNPPKEGLGWFGTLILWAITTPIAIWLFANVNPVFGALIIISCYMERIIANQERDQKK